MMKKKIWNANHVVAVDMDTNSSHCICMIHTDMQIPAYNLHIKQRKMEIKIDNPKFSHTNSRYECIFFYEKKYIYIIRIGKITQAINTFNTSGCWKHASATREKKRTRNEISISLCESNDLLAICRCAFNAQNEKVYVKWTENEHTVSPTRWLHKYRLSSLIDTRSYLLIVYRHQFFTSFVHTCVSQGYFFVLLLSSIVIYFGIFSLFGLSIRLPQLHHSVKMMQIYNFPNLNSQ